MSKSLKQKLVAYGLVMPAFLVVMLTVAYPIISAVIQSFQDEKTGAFTLDNYLYFFTEPAQQQNILYTLYVVFMTVVIAIVVAYCWRCICALSIRALQKHRHAVSAAAFRARDVRGLCDDYDHP